jgi:hypothetical protein
VVFKFNLLKNKKTNKYKMIWFDSLCLMPLSAISWRPVLVVEKAGVPERVNYQNQFVQNVKSEHYFCANIIYIGSKLYGSSQVKPNIDQPNWCISWSSIDTYDTQIQYWYIWYTDLVLIRMIHRSNIDTYDTQIQYWYIFNTGSVYHTHQYWISVSYVSILDLCIIRINTGSVYHTYQY